MYTKTYKNGTKELEIRHFRIEDENLAEALWHYVPTKIRRYTIENICEFDRDVLLKRLDISAGEMIEILRESGEDTIKDPIAAILDYSPEYSSFKLWDCPELRARLGYFVRDWMRTATRDITDNYEGWLELEDVASNEINK